MKSKLKRLGDYIRLVDVRNRNGSIGTDRLLGININKEFMPSVANVSETDLSKYKIINEGQFAYSAMQVGRDETIRVSLYDREDPAIISPAYLVFEVIDEQLVMPEFLMMCFHRQESDRYGWFISDSSVRASLEYDRFCDIRIPIPGIDEQRNSVALYNALKKNQQSYEKSLSDLQLICDTFLEDLKIKESHKRLGEYIQQSDERNHDLKNDNLRAISVNKKFMESKSDKEQLNLSGYKLIHPRQFGFVTVTSRNGEKISVAILEDEDCIVSSTYCVFGVKDTSKLMPEYLYLWFKRTEFDRYARFHSWGSARETFDWADMCNVKLPIPKPEVQESIVAIHHTLETRKRLNIELKTQIQNLCPILMRGVVENLSAKEGCKVKTGRV
jgi:type I restriction enzyme S subunit